MRSVPRALTGLATGISLLALTACGAVGPESGGERETTQQEVPSEITCANIGSELERIGTDLSEAAESAVSDPQGFISELQQLSDRVSQLTDSATDPELRTRMEAVETAIGEFVSSVSDGSALSDLGELQQQAQEVGDAVTAVSDYCSSAT